MKKSLIVINLLFLFITICNSQDLSERIEKCKKGIMENKYAEVLEESKSILANTELDSANIALVNTFAGVASKEIGQSQEALNYFKKSIEYKIPQFDIYEMFISLASDLGDDTNYEYGLMEETAAFPFQKETNDTKLINLYIKSKQYESLASFSLASIEAGSSDKSNLYYYAAYSYENLNKDTEAEKYYQESLTADPENMKSNLGLGMFYYKKASDEYKTQKEAYNKIKNPSRVDYDKYHKSLENSKAVYRKSLTYILKVYNDNPSDNLKGVIYNSYMRLGEKDKALAYK